METSEVKIKGRGIYHNGVKIGIIYGSREWRNGRPEGGYGYRLENGYVCKPCFAYFEDVCRHLRFNAVLEFNQNLTFERVKG